MFFINYKRFLLPLLIICCLNSSAQKTADQKKLEQQAQLKSLIDSKNYTFQANSVTTMKGKTIQLSGGYFLQVNKEKLSVSLPYYGRSYTTDYPPTNLSVEFTSDNFSYKADTSKKGGWEIAIVPVNEPKANKINISVSASGYCTVRINSSSRQPISYYGMITTGPDK